MHGLISREATDQVTDKLIPGLSDTICLALLVTGDAETRLRVRQQPCITVDGCDKLCAKRGTERYSGKVAASLVVSDILGDRVAGCHRSSRDYDQADEEAVALLAERIATEVDAISAAAPQSEPLAVAQKTSCPCAWGSRCESGNLTLDGKTVTIDGLPVIFGHLRALGLAASTATADRLLENVRIYHRIEPHEEDLYRNALTSAYMEFCQASRQP